MLQADNSRSTLMLSLPRFSISSTPNYFRYRMRPPQRKKSNGFVEFKHVTMRQLKKIQTFAATTENRTNARQNFTRRMEKAKMPFFNGTIRGYPQFKQDFQKQVMPTLDKNSACYILRSCLEREPAETVKGVDDDIKEMWKRFDEKYGDPAKLTDAIINTIQDIRPIKEGENKRFIELVDAVEDGYKDLKRLGLEREITTTSSISIIERKLPATIKREWA